MSFFGVQQQSCQIIRSSWTELCATRGAGFQRFRRGKDVLNCNRAMAKRGITTAALRREGARTRIAKLPLTNCQLAELLALEGERAQGYVRKAFFRAAHAAFLWPEEAANLIAQERSLTELPAVGPFLAKAIRSWIEQPPEDLPLPAEVRRNFLSLTEANGILSEASGWREKLRGDLQMHTRWSDGSATV